MIEEAWGSKNIKLNERSQLQMDYTALFMCNFQTRKTDRDPK